MPPLALGGAVLAHCRLMYGRTTTPAHDEPQDWVAAGRAGAIRLALECLETQH